MSQMIATKTIRTAIAHSAKPLDAKSLGAKPMGLLERWFVRWQQRRQTRRDEAFLLRQPDYLLRDIGVDRGEIETLVRRGRYYR